MFGWLVRGWVLQVSLEVSSPVDLVICLLEVTDMSIAIAEADAIWLPVELVWFNQCLVVDIRKPPGSFKVIVMEHIG